MLALGPSHDARATQHAAQHGDRARVLVEGEALHRRVVVRAVASAVGDHRAAPGRQEQVHVAGAALVEERRRAAGLRSLSVDDCLLGFWVGLAAVLLGLMAAHFFVPIGGGALLFVLAGGGLSLWSWRGELRRILGEARAGVVAPWAFAFALVAFWVANASLAPMNNSDTAGYHLPAIRWVGTYPVVPGLANLFGPLGFNNVSFPVIALHFLICSLLHVTVA